MRIKLKASQSGIALIMVMLVVVVLAILAAGFAYSMKVETKLARNASFDSELEWMGRSGIELARYVLAQEGQGPAGQFDSLKQKWAGGPGESNSPVANIPMDNYELGLGTISVKIVDCDRKFNINKANADILREALTLIGVDAGSFPTIVDSILVWRDPQDKPLPSGSQSEYYQSLTPPYFAKNGPIDDMSELLLVHGVTPEMYWGSGAAGHVAMINKPARTSRGRFEEPIYEIGLNELFTSTSGGFININTASAKVLQIIPGIQENMADAIVQARSGGNGPNMGAMPAADGSDYTPFRSVQELARVPEFAAYPQLMQMVGNYFSVRSLVFEVTVKAQIGNSTRTYVALLKRASPRDIQVMSMYWK